MTHPRPGLVNAHTHLELTALSHLYPRETADLADWIPRLVQARAAATEAQLSAGIAQAIAALHECNTVAVGDITSTGLSVEPLLASGLAGVAYFEVLGTDEDAALARLDEARRKIEVWRRRERNGMRVGLSVHAPYSCHPSLLREGARWCARENVPLCIHLAESRAEVELLTENRGPLRELNRKFNVPDIPCPHLRPLPYFDRLGVLEARPLLVHMIEVTADEVAATKDAHYSVVHCPRSNRALRCGRFPIEHYLAHGVNVSLGTDSLASSPSLDVAEDVDAAFEMQEGKYPRELFEKFATEGGRAAVTV